MAQQVNYSIMELGPLPRSSSMESLEAWMEEEKNSEWRVGEEVTRKTRPSLGSEENFLQVEGRRHPPRLSRENSFITFRDRSKSFEGGVLHPTPHSIAARAALEKSRQSSIHSQFRPPLDYNVLHWLTARLNRIRRNIRKRENATWMKGKKVAQRIVESIVFWIVMGVVVLTHSVVLGLYQPEVMGDRQFVDDIIFYITVGVLVLFVVEAILNMVAYGVLLHPNVSYLRRPMFLLDLVVILFGFLFVILRSSGVDSALIFGEMFASFMALKLIRLLTFSKSVRFMLKALAKSARPLSYLSILTFLVILFLALVGIELFHGDLHGGCFSNYTTPSGTNRSILVTEFPCRLDGNETRSVVDEHVCPYNSECTRWERGPYQGIVSFDNVGRALVVVVQSITLEGWSGIFFLYESAVGQAYAWAYFLLVIFLGSVFLLNMWTGVLTIVFVDVSEREQKEGSHRQLMEEKRIEKDMMQYNDWMKKGAELQHPSDTGSIDRSHGLGLSMFPPSEKEEESDEEEEEEQGKYGGFQSDSTQELKKEKKGCYHSTSRVVQHIVESKVWLWVIILAHIANLFLLMSLKFPSSPGYLETIYECNYFFSALFVSDIILKLYGLGPIKFFKKEHDTFYHVSSKVMEAALAVLSVFALVMISYPPVRDFQLPVLLNAIWCIKIVLVGKISADNWEHVQEVLKTLGQLFKVIVSLMALLGLFLYIFTIWGIRLFGNRLSITNVVQPNFDNFPNSLFLVFQLLTTEDWHNVMYNSVGAYIAEVDSTWGFATVIYFLLAIILGAFILVNAFLALSVDKLSEIRDLEEDQSKEEETEEKERKEREEQLTALKDPKFEVRRRTIRRMIQFQSSNPKERLGAAVQASPTGSGEGVGGAKKSWWKQVSLPLFSRSSASEDTQLPVTDSGPRRSFIKSVSTPTGSVSTPTHLLCEGDELGVIHEGEEFSDPSLDSADGVLRKAEGTPKLRNPLRHVKNPPSYIELNIPPEAHDNVVPTTALASRLARMQRKKSPPPPVIPSAIPEEEGEGGGASPSFTSQHRQMSVVSSPAVPGLADVGGVVGEGARQVRSYSLPLGYSRPPLLAGHKLASDAIPEADSDAGSGSISKRDSFRSPTPPSQPGSGSERRSSMDSTVQRKLSRQDSVHAEEELSCVLTSESPTPQSGGSGRYSLTQRYVRGSSLEPIHLPPSRPVPREPFIKKSTRDEVWARVRAAYQWMKEYFGALHFDPSKELKEIPPHSSFFILDHNNSFRKFCFRLVRSQTFRVITYVMIAVSSIVLMLELPNGISDQRVELCAIQRVIIYIDIGLIVFFFMEMILKMISLGVFVHRNSYLRNMFNLLDFLVTILTLIPIVIYLEKAEDQEGICISYGYDSMAVDPAVGSLRVLRVLRPLRAIRIKGLYLVVTGLLSSIKAMVSIFFLDALIVVIFGIIGVHFFKGSFYFCTDATIETEEECVGYFFNYDYTAGLNTTVPGLTCPIAEARVWTQPGLNFDNIGNATLSLFTMVTAEGWQNVMYSGVNSRTPNDSQTPLARILENKPEAAVYYILYMVVMTFILLQLFVGFVIVTFQEVGVKAYRETKLNRNQRNCLYFALRTRPRHRWSPKYDIQFKILKKLYPVVDSLPVRGLIMLVLVFNTVVLCAQFDGADERIYYYINIGCSIFFFFEAVIKIVVLSPPIYFKNVWNAFAFFIVVASTVELIVQYSGVLESGKFQYSHLASTLRVLRILEFIPQVRRILWTVIRALEIFPWVAILLIIIIYTYAVFGMHLFGRVARVTVDESDTRGIHQYNSFATFPNAMVLMTRVITGENWQDVMLDCLQGVPCDNTTGITQSGEVCGNDSSYIFFPSFYLISTIMILNLFVAVIMDNFEYIVWDRSQLGAYDLRIFVKYWSKFDTGGKGMLKPEKVFDLLRKIDPPVGWGKLCPRVTAYKKMMRLNIPVRRDREEVEGVLKEVKVVTFNATLFALVRTTLDIDCKGCPDCKRRCNVELREKLVKLFPNISGSRFDEVLAKEAEETVADEYAALLVQAEWRSFMLRRRRIVDIFKGAEKTLNVHREIQDPGPDLTSSRPLSTFNQDLEILDYPLRKLSGESSQSRSTDPSRLGSRSPRSPLSTPMPMLEPSGLEWLWDPSSPSDINKSPRRYRYSVASASGSGSTRLPGGHTPRPTSTNLSPTRGTSPAGHAPIPSDHVSLSPLSPRSNNPFSPSLTSYASNSPTPLETGGVRSSPIPSVSASVYHDAPTSKVGGASPAETRRSEEDGDDISYASALSNRPPSLESVTQYLPLDSELRETSV